MFSYISYKNLQDFLNIFKKEVLTMKALLRRNGNPQNSLRVLSPFEDLENMVNRVFDSYYSQNEQDLGIRLELSEKNNEFLLKAKVPGLKKDDVNIEVGEDYVSLSGEYKKEEYDEDTIVYRSEFSSGAFCRSIGLPSKINHQKAKAEYKDGILTLILPKSEEEKQKITKLTI